MNIRNLLLASLMIFSGAAFAQEEPTNQVYAQEFVAFADAPENQAIFDEEMHPELHNIERDMHNFKSLNLMQRLACLVFLANDVIVVTPENMPKLYAFIDDLCKKSDMPTPAIFITIREGFYNAFAGKFFTSVGGIVICQKLLFASSDTLLEGVIAHEIGHVKHNHTNKNLALKAASFTAGLLAMYGIQTYIKEKLGMTDQPTSFREYALGFMAANTFSWLVNGLVIGKSYEQQADEFAFKAGHAKGLIEFFEQLKENEQKVESDFAATNEHLQSKKSELPVAEFNTLQQTYNKAFEANALRKWLHATRFVSHPLTDDRIQAAQAYLPEPEKA